MTAKQSSPESVAKRPSQLCQRLRLSYRRPTAAIQSDGQLALGLASPMPACDSEQQRVQAIDYRELSPEGMWGKCPSVESTENRGQCMLNASEVYECMAQSWKESADTSIANIESVAEAVSDSKLSMADVRP